jgi:hypothetical protein
MDNTRLSLQIGHIEPTTMQKITNPLDEPGQQWSRTIKLTVLCAIAGASAVLYLSHSQTGRTGKVKSADAAFPGDWMEPNSQTLAKAPPMFLLQPAKMRPNSVPFEMFGKDRYLARGKTVQQLIAAVYAQKNSAAKLNFLTSMPDDKYDCLVTLQTQTKWWDTLESEINKRFNLVTQYEQREGKAACVIKSAN